jgi:hypothetical protein
LLAACAVLWAAYAAYVAAHWTDFLGDMAFQFTWRDGSPEHAAGFLARWLDRDMLVLLALAGAVLVYGTRKRVEATFLMAFALPLGVLNVVTVGWQYEIYVSLLVLLACVLFVEMGLRLAVDPWRGRSPLWSRSLHAAVLIGGVALLVYSGRIESPVGYPHEMRFSGMRIASQVPYYTENDAQLVRRFLRSLESSATPVTVAFYPGAEALLFLDLRSERLRFVQPTFHDGRPDVQIVHLSRYMPARPEALIRAQIAFQSGTSTPLDRWPALHRRHGTEKWLVHRAGHRDP